MEKRKLVVSSIAWQQAQEDIASDMLSDLGVTNVEVSPTKLWPDKIKEDPALVSNEETQAFKDYWSAHKIKPVAMQSMMYLRPDLKLLYEETSEQSIEYLEKFIELSSKMGVEKMVFGSPKNRILNPNLSYDENYSMAVDLFRKIGLTATRYGVIFCIEPNPEAYNCNFIVNAKEGRQLVSDVNSNGFQLHLDAAGMTLAGDNVYDEIVASEKYMKHFHISAPYLNPVVDDKSVDHSAIAKALKDIKYSDYLSIEMKPDEVDSNNISNIENAVSLTNKYYFSS